MDLIRRFRSKKSRNQYRRLSESQTELVERRGRIDLKMVKVSKNDENNQEISTTEATGHGNDVKENRGTETSR